MKYIQTFVQTIFLLSIPLLGNAETTCLDKVKALELKRNYAVSIGGMWGYFEKNFSLKKVPTEAIQIDDQLLRNTCFVPANKRHDPAFSSATNGSGKV